MLQPLKFYLLSLLTALICITTSPGLATLPIIAPLLLSHQAATTAESLEQQGRSLYATGQFTAAAAAFQQAAFETWQRTATLFEELGEQERASESRINQAQALQTLGLYRRAIATLVTALEWQPQTLSTVETLQPQLQTLPDTPTKVAALLSLGEALRVTGNLELSRAILQRGLALAQQLPQPEAVAIAQFRLGNLTRMEALVNLNRSNLTPAAAVELVRKGQKGDRRLGINQAETFYAAMNKALELYRHVVATSPTPSTKIQAQLNQLRVLVETERQAEIPEILPQVQQGISRLPLSPTAIDARINLAQSLMKLGSRESGTEIAQILAIALQQAKELQDPRRESYALGYLGELYEQTGQVTDAQQFAQQALLLAQSNQALDIAYRWQWLLGRLLKTQGDKAGSNREAYEKAIAAYTEAVNTLQTIRNDLIAITPEEQLSFRDTIEPIYRQLVALLLHSERNQPNTQNLKAARDVIESLQLAELDNFFREACLDSNPTLIDRVDQEAAIFYPIILPEQLAVIISLPQQNSSQSASRQSTLGYYTVPVSQQDIEATVSLLRDLLDQANDNRFLQPAQQLYDWLIRPAKEQLETSKVTTLVFVLDGVLRNIPMTVLHDGQRYLIEQPYNVALTPGLQLLEAQPLAQNQLKSALLAGLTEARPGFSALPRVRDELEQIQAEIPDTTILLDQGSPASDDELTIDGGFTNANFQTVIAANSFPIVHLATHGQFSSQVEETYILTEDSRLNIEALKNSLQTTAIRQDGALELLVLSACETAAGDERAALGLAGVAVRAGAHSTIATLWQVNDYSSAVFMGQFYRELAKVQDFQMSRAEALHRAQLSLLQNPDYQHPFFWAPYVLIGNW